MDITGTGYLTNYTYDMQNHKTTITQGSQTRVFQTDAAGRPISTQEPERGVTTYSYVYGPAAGCSGTGLCVTRTCSASEPDQSFNHNDHSDAI